jgi:hypothetical protein
LFAHDLFGKPLHTFPDHALALDTQVRGHQSCDLCRVRSRQIVTAAADNAKA